MAELEQAIVQRIAVKAFVLNDAGQVLLLREAATDLDNTNVGHYQLPGGRIELGEAFLDGLRREVDEETGLEIEIGRPIHVAEWRPISRGVPNQIVCIFFACRALTSTVRLSKEHDDFQWITPEDWAEYPVMSPEDQVFAEYLSRVAA